MFMRFLGSGIGHRASDLIQPSTAHNTTCTQDEALESHNKDTIYHDLDAQGHSQEGKEGADADEDPEVDTNGEADYGYVDDHCDHEFDTVGGKDMDLDLDSEGKEELYDVL